MKKIAMAVALLFATMGSAFAQNEENASEFKRGLFDHVAVNVGYSTEGFGIGVAAPINNFVELEAGVNMMPSLKISGDLTVDGGKVNVSNGGNSGTITIPDTKVHIKGDFSRTTFNIKANVYPFGGNSKFFVSGGLSFGGKKLAKVTGSCSELQEIVENQYPQYKQQIMDAIGANLGGYSIKLDDLYNVEGDVRCNSVRPYLGLGFGRTVPKNRIGFRFEMGCQFMGGLKVYQNGQQLDTEQALKDAGADDDMSKIVENWAIYPVIKLSIVGRIF